MNRNYRTKKLIAVDVDEVLAGFMAALVAFHNSKFGTTLTPGHFISYDFHTVWGGTREESVAKMEEFFASEYFLDRIEPISGAQGAMTQLHELYDLHVVTSRQYVVEEETRRWIDKYFPNIFTEIHFGNHYARSLPSISKSDMCLQIGASVLIDDSSRYATECAAKGIPVVLFGDYAWNRECPESNMIRRVKDWSETMELLLSSDFLQLHPTPPLSPIPGLEGLHTDREVMDDDEEEDDDVVLLAAIQMCSTNDKDRNLGTILRLVTEAAGRGASLICLPENCICMGTPPVSEMGGGGNAESLDGPSICRLGQLASHLGVFLSIGGFQEIREEEEEDLIPAGPSIQTSSSIPTSTMTSINNKRDSHKTTINNCNTTSTSNTVKRKKRKTSNTHVILSPHDAVGSGLVGRGRGGGSGGLPGDIPVVVTLPLETLRSRSRRRREVGVDNDNNDNNNHDRLPVTVAVTVGLTVCYDLRFPELYSTLRSLGAELFLVPAAFTLLTGRAGHWETLLRARAIEQQCYVLAAAQAGRHNVSRVSYGQSLGIDCWGKIVSQCQSVPDEGTMNAQVWRGEEGICYLPYSTHRLKEVRSGMPVQVGVIGDRMCIQTSTSTARCRSFSMFCSRRNMM
eukprot:gene6412-12966_t